jgi:hypothetical protein
LVLNSWSATAHGMLSSSPLRGQFKVSVSN